MYWLVMLLVSFLTPAALTTTAQVADAGCCCGAACVCENCVCVESGCACDQGGESVCGCCADGACWAAGASLTADKTDSQGATIATAKVAKKSCCSVN